MNLNVMHQRLMHDVVEIGNDLPLVLMGGYAVQAHNLVDRMSHDIDMATDSDIPMAEIVTLVTGQLHERGWDMRVIGIDALGARMMATDPVSGEQCELDILKEAFGQPPEVTEYGPVLALDDVIGTKMRALAGRGLPRDLIDIQAAAHLRTHTELESLYRRHAREGEFSLEGLKDRLDGADWYDDQAFAEYGLTTDQITALRAWAQAWSDNISRRLYRKTLDNGVDDHL
jgi:hypothetical protein